MAKSDFSEFLNSLPGEMRELVSSLLPDDLEVLAYFIAYIPVLSCGGAKNSEPGKRKQCLCEGSSARIAGRSTSSRSRNTSSPALQEGKPVLSEYHCFHCYKSYWSRWTSSPNSKTITEAINLHEELMAKAREEEEKVKKLLATAREEERRMKKIEKRGKGRRRGQDKGKQDLKVEQVATPKVETLVLTNGQNAPGDSTEVQQQLKGLSKVIKSVGVDVSGDNAGRNNAKKTNARRKGQGSSSNKERAKSNKVVPLQDKEVPDLRAEAEDEEEELKEPSVFHRGKKIINLVASRLWGYLDRNAD